MATPKQVKLAEVIIENSVLDKPATAVAMLEKVGYSRFVAEAKAKDIINSMVYKKHCMSVVLLLRTQRMLSQKSF